MKVKKFTDQAFFFSISSFKNERRKLIEDSFGASADLHLALYETKNEPLRSVEFERYELLTLKRQWETAVTEATQLSEEEYYAVRRLFVKTYRSYVAGIRGTLIDMDLLDAHLAGIERLLETNKNWEEDLKRLCIDFERNEKILSDKIDEMRKAGDK